MPPEGRRAIDYFRTTKRRIDWRLLKIAVAVCGVTMVVILIEPVRGILSILWDQYSTKHSHTLAIERIRQSLGPDGQWCSADGSSSPAIDREWLTLIPRPENHKSTVFTILFARIIDHPVDGRYFVYIARVGNNVVSGNCVAGEGIGGFVDVVIISPCSPPRVKTVGDEIWLHVSDAQGHEHNLVYKLTFNGPHYWPTLDRGDGWIGYAYWDFGPPGTRLATLPPAEILAAPPRFQARCSPATRTTSDPLSLVAGEATNAILADRLDAAIPAEWRYPSSPTTYIPPRAGGTPPIRSPSGRSRIADADGELRVESTQPGAAPIVIRPERASDMTPLAVAWSADETVGAAIVVERLRHLGRDRGWLYVWSSKDPADRWAARTALLFDPYRPVSLILSPDGNTVAVEPAADLPVRLQWSLHTPPREMSRLPMDCRKVPSDFR